LYPLTILEMSEDMMIAGKIIAALAALAHEHRLGAYRLLIEAGPNGLPAGQVAERLGLAHLSPTALASRRADYTAKAEPSAHLRDELRGNEWISGVPHRELLRSGRRRRL
jgi:hypothetical protein